MMRRELILLISIPLLMGLMGQVVAEEKITARGMSDSHGQQAEEYEEEGEVEPQTNDQGIPVGRFTASFDGYDEKSRSVWLNDFRYELYPGYKVIGKHSKRASLSSILFGERVDVVVEANSKSPTTPYLVEIRRRK